LNIPNNVCRYREEKVRLLQELSKFNWLHPVPSSANFYLVKVTGPLEASQVTAYLRRAGVLVRYFTNPLLINYFRVSVGRPSDTDALISTLRQLEKSVLDAYIPQALLWDMDGVLADVSQSYRQAIVRTAATFGVEISHSDIAQAKMAGNANNDWILTHKLIGNFTKSADPIPDLERVTETFEKLYQGELRFLEKLLVSSEILSKFGSCLPMAIVTGRPRGDAINFLETHQISGFFQHLVCMEDAPCKPDPAPVHLALQKLGISRAIMIGDTPDDIRAAVAAGIMGVGVSFDL
jgi:histidinol-phosphate aminotransferase